MPHPQIVRSHWQWFCSGHKCQCKRLSRIHFTLKSTLWFYSRHTKLWSVSVRCINLTVSCIYEIFNGTEPYIPRVYISVVGCKVVHALLKGFQFGLKKRWESLTHVVVFTGRFCVSKCVLNGKVWDVVLKVSWSIKNNSGIWSELKKQFDLLLFVHVIYLFFNIFNDAMWSKISSVILCLVIQRIWRMFRCRPHRFCPNKRCKDQNFFCCLNHYLCKQTLKWTELYDVIHSTKWNASDDVLKHEDVQFDIKTHICLL